MEEKYLNESVKHQTKIQLDDILRYIFSYFSKKIGLGIVHCLQSRSVYMHRTCTEKSVQLIQAMFFFFFHLDICL